VLVGAVLPAGAPHALESGAQAREAISRPERDVVRDPVDHGEPPGGRSGLAEAEKGEDIINVD
jgi:hypothetical protein